MEPDSEDGSGLTGMSYDNSGGLGASTWRHVAFVEPLTSRSEAFRLSWHLAGIPAHPPALR
jgi:hypothetical protein